MADVIVANVTCDNCYLRQMFIMPTVIASVIMASVLWHMKLSNLCICLYQIINCLNQQLTLVVPHPVTVTKVPTSGSSMALGNYIGFTKSVRSRDLFN